MNDKKFLLIVCGGAASILLVVLCVALVASSNQRRHADREEKIASGWEDFEGRFISPEQKVRILEDRRQEAVVREERAFRERARAEAARRERARLAAERQAREMYGPYRESAEAVADELLRLNSSITVGLDYRTYGEMLRELQFKYDKFASARNDEERKYDSFKYLTSSVEAFRTAMGHWRLKIDSKNKSEEEVADELLQYRWVQAKQHYDAAMKALGEGK